MENNEVIEGNKLIAEFFGNKQSEKHFKISEFGHNKTGFFGWRDEGASTIYKDVFMDYELQFHKSWDWLMPVYKKFIDLPFSENSMQAIRNNYSVRINAAICAVDIKEAHRHLTNGIKWYKTTNLK